MSTLSFLLHLPKAVKYLWRAHRWARAQSVAFPSPEFFAVARKAVEELALGVAKGLDEDLLALFPSRDGFLLGVAVFLRSDALLAVHDAQGFTARLMAEKALHEQDPAKMTWRVGPKSK